MYLIHLILKRLWLCTFVHNFTINCVSFILFYKNLLTVQRYYSPKVNKLTVFLKDNFKAVNNVYLRLRMKIPLFSTTSEQKVMMNILVNSKLRM